jgi:hypothetical protein
VDVLSASQDAALAEREVTLRTSVGQYRKAMDDRVLATGQGRGTGRAGRAAPGVLLMRRYAAKAAELRVSVGTVKRWVAAALEEREAALVGFFP